MTIFLEFSTQKAMLGKFQFWKRMEWGERNFWDITTIEIKYFVQYLVFDTKDSIHYSECPFILTSFLGGGRKEISDINNFKIKHFIQ